VTGYGCGGEVGGSKIRCRLCANVAGRRWPSRRLWESRSGRLSHRVRRGRRLAAYLGVAEAAHSRQDVIEALAGTKREVWRRFWGQS
jgi:hypothetical protein